MKKVVALGLLAVLLVGIITSCNDGGSKLKIKGNIASAEGKTVYLGHLGLDGISIVDSVKVAANGNFSFKQDAPKNPEFYILKIDNQQATFSADSTKTYVLKADARDLPNTLTVENSPVNAQIKQINVEQSKFAQTLKALGQAHTDKKIDDVSYLHQLDSALLAYKAFATDLILSNPAGAAAYYAVFQKVDDYLIFDPHDKKDYGMFAAVATSWDKDYPETPRTKHLHDFVITALKARKMEERNQELLQNAEVITSLKTPELKYGDVNGNTVSLSSLQGKVVLVDFTVYTAEFSPKHNMQLNSIYNRLKSRGLEIYQVSLDSEEHLWKNAAVNLPWITVRDPQSVYSNVLSTFNLRNIPTSFIIDRQGNIVSRIENPAVLESEIAKYL